MDRWITKAGIDGLERQIQMNRKKGNRKAKIDGQKIRNRWIENQEQMDRKGPKYLYVTIFNKNQLQI